MTPVLIEPAALFLDGAGTNPAEVGRRLSWIRDFLRLNQGRVPFSLDLWNDIEGHMGLADPQTEEHWRYHEHWHIVRTIASDHFENPMVEWEGQEDFVDPSSMRRRSHIYDDDSRWMAWTDLLAQCLRNQLEVLGLLVSCRQRSCVRDADGNDFRLGVRGDSGTSLPIFEPGYIGKMLDPDAAQRLMSRAAQRSDSEPKASWEKNAEPAMHVKRLLGRTANCLKGLVISYGTWEKIPNASEEPKLEPEPDWAEISFRLYDSRKDLLFKGYFLTIAEDAAEAAVALHELRTKFDKLCASEKGVRGSGR